MNRKVVVYAVLFAALMLASYLTWTHERTEAPEGEAVVLEAEIGDVVAMSFRSDDLHFELKVETDDAGRYATIETERRRVERVDAEPEAEADSDADGRRGSSETGGPESGDTGERGDTGESGDTGERGDTADSGDAGEHGDTADSGDTGERGDTGGSEEPPEASAADLGPVLDTATLRYDFTGGHVADNLLEFVSPLMAERALGVVEQARLVEFGLAPPQGTWTVVLADGAHHYELGDPLMTGRQVYLRDADTGEVYAVKGKLSSWLLRADTQLPARALSPLQPDEMARVTIEAGGETVRIEQRNRLPRNEDGIAPVPASPEEGPYWAREGSTERDDAAGAWMTKALRITARRFVQEDEVPTGLELRFAIILSADDGRSTRVEVFEATDTEGPTSWYARSTYTRRLVEINESLASESADDLDQLLK